MGMRAGPGDQGRTSARHVAGLGLALLLLLGAACGDTEQGGTSAAGPDGAGPGGEVTDDSTPAEAEPTTTTLPPGGRVPTPEDPLRVLLAGDSVMAGLAPAVTSALESGGAADATFTLSPTLPHEDLDWAGWQARLAELQPEVVVVLVGVWERTEVSIADPAWRSGWDAAVRDPFAEMVDAAGARLLWVGMPAVPQVALSLEFAALNDAFQEQAAQATDGSVQYVDGPAAVAAPDGTHPAVIPRPGGRLARVRQVDGTHLCADGSTLMARAVLETLQGDWQVPVGETWTTDAWRGEIGTAAQCPPA
jgi:hypothetical protein